MASLLGLMVAATAASAAGAGSPEREPCYVTAHGSMIALVCGAAPHLPGRDCCSSLLKAAEKGGLRCLCDAASSPDLLTSGFTASDLLRWYRECGGRRPINLSDIVSTCADIAVSTYSESVGLPMHASVLLGTPPPPPPTPTTFGQPVVVVAPVKNHHRRSPWPWVVLALGVLAFTAMMTVICCLGCGRIVKSLIQLGVWLFSAGMMSGNEGTTGPRIVDQPDVGANSAPRIMDQPEPDLILLDDDRNVKHN